MKISYFITIILIVAIIIPVCSKTEVSGEYKSSSLGSYLGRSQDSSPGSQSQQRASDVGSPSESRNVRPAGPTPIGEETSLGDNSIAINLIYPKQNIHISDFAPVGVEVINKADQSIKFSLIESIDRSLAAFYPSVNGYTLSDNNGIMYYEQNLLEYFECGNSSYNLGSYDSSIDYDEMNSCLANINKKSIDEQSKDVQRFLNKSPIFEWDDVKNGSLKDCVNLSNFVKYRLQAMIDREIDAAKVYRYQDNISIYLGNKSIINITKNNDIRDRGYSILSYNNLAFHLKMHEGAVYDIGDTLYFKDVTLNKGQMFVFWCYIKPLSVGSFDARTYVIVDNPRNIILNSATINVENNPNFRVTRTFSKYQNLLNDELDITFDIDYLGGGIEPDIKYVKVFFEKSNEYEYISLNGAKCTNEMKENPIIEENFTKNVSKIINVKIRLNTPGVISPPSLKINGDYKPFYDTITVDRPVARYFNYITLFFTILSFIIIFLFKDVCLDSTCGDHPAKTYKQIFGERLVKWIQKRSKKDLFFGMIALIIVLAVLAFLIVIIIVPIFDYIIRYLVDLSSIME